MGQVKSLEMPDLSVSIRELADLDVEIDRLNADLERARDRRSHLRRFLGAAKQLYSIDLPFDEAETDERAGTIKFRSRPSSRAIRRGTGYDAITAATDALGRSLTAATAATLIEDTIAEVRPDDAAEATFVVQSEEGPPPEGETAGESRATKISTRDAVKTALELYSSSTGLDIDELQTHMEDLGWSSDSENPTNVVRTMVLRLVKEDGPCFQPERGRYGWHPFRAATEAAIKDEFVSPDDS